MSNTVRDAPIDIEVETGYLTRVLATQFAAEWAAGASSKRLLELCKGMEAYIDPFVKDAKKARDDARAELETLRRGRLAWWRRQT